MSKILWDHVESHYRAQSNSGVILSIDDDAMLKALKNAGNGVFDTEWWMETLPNVLEHWGLRSKRWIDPPTQMPRIHYRLTADRVPTGPLPTPPPNPTFSGTGPLSNRLNGTAPLTSRTAPSSTGPLTNRLNSGRLNTGNLNSGKLNEDDK